MNGYINYSFKLHHRQIFEMMKEKQRDDFHENV